MQITIEGKEYDLYFGLDFLEWCEDNAGLKVDGVNMGIGGFNMLYSKLEMNDPVAIMKILKGATNTLKSKPSNTQLEFFLEGKIVEDEFEEFAEELQDTLKKQPFTSVQIKKMNQNQNNEE